ncbi:uncharacterized protein LOC143244163 [Tachypleus tridentatus]|uniref:uncharacterized protein LOC143244163 n=1 Tax=Tachypleus tridentatus TaxID=6853 RepID=UPI003FD00DE4
MEVFDEKKTKRHLNSIDYTNETSVDLGGDCSKIDGIKCTKRKKEKAHLLSHISGQRGEEKVWLCEDSDPRRYVSSKLKLNFDVLMDMGRDGSNISSETETFTPQLVKYDPDSLIEDFSLKRNLEKEGDDLAITEEDKHSLGLETPASTDLEREELIRDLCLTKPLSGFTVYDSDTVQKSGSSQADVKLLLVDFETSFSNVTESSENFSNQKEMCENKNKTDALEISASSVNEQAQELIDFDKTCPTSLNSSKKSNHFRIPTSPVGNNTCFLSTATITLEDESLWTGDQETSTRNENYYSQEYKSIFEKKNITKDTKEIPTHFQSKDTKEVPTLFQLRPTEKAMSVSLTPEFPLTKSSVTINAPDDDPEGAKIASRIQGIVGSLGGTEDLRKQFSRAAENSTSVLSFPDMSPSSTNLSSVDSLSNPDFIGEAEDNSTETSSGLLLNISASVPDLTLLDFSTQPSNEDKSMTSKKVYFDDCRKKIGTVGTSSSLVRKAALERQQTTVVPENVIKSYKKNVGKTEEIPSDHQLGSHVFNFPHGPYSYSGCTANHKDSRRAFFERLLSTGHAGNQHFNPLTKEYHVKNGAESVSNPSQKVDTAVQTSHKTNFIKFPHKEKKKFGMRSNTRASAYFDNETTKEKKSEIIHSFDKNDLLLRDVEHFKMNESNSQEEKHKHFTTGAFPKEPSKITKRTIRRILRDSELTGKKEEIVQEIVEEHFDSKGRKTYRTEGLTRNWSSDKEATLSRAIVVTPDGKKHLATTVSSGSVDDATMVTCNNIQHVATSVSSDDVSVLASDRSKHLVS